MECDPLSLSQFAACKLSCFTFAIKESIRSAYISRPKSSSLFSDERPSVFFFNQLSSLWTGCINEHEISTSVNNLYPRAESK